MRALLFVIAVVIGCGGSDAAKTELSLSWQDNADDEQGFTVERKDGASGTFVEVTSLGVDATTYVDADVVAGTEYCYRVRAFNASGSSDYSNEACGTSVAARLVPVNIGSQQAGPGIYR